MNPSFGTPLFPPHVTSYRQGVTFSPSITSISPRGNVETIGASGKTGQVPCSQASFPTRNVDIPCPIGQNLSVMPHTSMAQPQLYQQYQTYVPTVPPSSSATTVPIPPSSMADFGNIGSFLVLSSEGGHPQQNFREGAPMSAALEHHLHQQNLPKDFNRSNPHHVPGVSENKDTGGGGVPKSNLKVHSPVKSSLKSGCSNTSVQRAASGGVVSFDVDKATKEVGGLDSSKGQGFKNAQENVSSL